MIGLFVAKLIILASGNEIIGSALTWIGIDAHLDQNLLNLLAYYAKLFVSVLFSPTKKFKEK